MNPSQNNPFRKDDDLANAVSDILNKSQQQKQDTVPDNVVSAAKAAGAEYRDAGPVPVETKNTIYRKHFSGAVGDSEVSGNTRDSFEKLADQEFNTPPPPTE